MKCLYCGGEMERGKAPFHIDRKGIHLTLDDIPAWICQQCGESYLEDVGVESIQAMIKMLEKETQKLSAMG